MHEHTHEHARTERGFTILELLVALTLGLVVLSSALAFAVTSWRNVEGNKYREGVYRSGRFIGMSLERDLRGTGVGIASTVSFGTLAVWADTIIVLEIPHEPDESPPYDLDPGPGTDDPLPSGGTCGARCIELKKVNGTFFGLKVGDLARLQVKDARHLIIVESVADNGTTVSVTFTPATTLLHYPAGLAGDLRLTRSGTFVQKLKPTIYYVDGEHLMRAQGLNLDGTPNADVMSAGVQSWNVSLIFIDGDEASEVVTSDSDPTNDFDDVVGLRINAILAADRAHPRVNDGKLFTRTYEWRFSPRNLMYQRNAL